MAAGCGCVAPLSLSLWPMLLKCNGHVVVDVVRRICCGGVDDIIGRWNKQCVPTRTFESPTILQEFLTGISRDGSFTFMGEKLLCSPVSRNPTLE